MTLTEAQSLARSIDPAARIVAKTGRFWSFLATIIGPFVGRRNFLENYATTIGPVQAYPQRWIDAGLEAHLIVHESQHVRQARAFGFGIHPWVGVPLMAIAYLLLPFPVVFAYFRFRLELGAERAAAHWAVAHGYDPAYVASRAAAFGRLVCGRAYGWAWPLGRRAFERVLDE